MTKSASRILLTILMYCGVMICLFPYFGGNLTTGVLFIVIGIAVAVACGMLRCYFMDGDCTDPEARQITHKDPSATSHPLPASHKR